jgi:hypothetical protein
MIGADVVAAKYGVVVLSTTEGRVTFCVWTVYLYLELVLLYLYYCTARSKSIDRAGYLWGASFDVVDFCW